MDFDPTHGDAEMLAILLWDYFGPYSPRTAEEIQERSFKASPAGVAHYRQCANDIAQSLRFYRNIQFDELPPRDAGAAKNRPATDQ